MFLLREFGKTDKASAYSNCHFEPEYAFKVYSYKKNRVGNFSPKKCQQKQHIKCTKKLKSSKGSFIYN